ncbi:MAG: hypothetical protein Q7T20_13595 [Saprospiraceae bacterium]|nr:hypothetical protein [Saprospiraceae bacterium]
MFRSFLSLLAFCLFIHGLNAQTDTTPSSRLTVQQLSPESARLHQETTEVESFSNKLAALKTAFAAKDASRIVAYEAYLLRALHHETEQMAARNPAGQHLGKMTAILAAFEAHAFDPARPESAARDFAKLDEFLKIMQEELESLKIIKR